MQEDVYDLWRFSKYRKPRPQIMFPCCMRRDGVQTSPFREPEYLLVVCCRVNEVIRIKCLEQFLGHVCIV